MLRFLRIERPITQTLRPVSTATSIACCMRCTFEANDAMSTRPSRTGMICRNASPTSRSEPVTPGRSAFVESPSSRSTPRLPISASMPDVGAQAVDGRVVDLVVAGVDDPRPPGLEDDRDRVRDRVRHAHELGLERADLDGARLGLGLVELGRVQQPVLVELRLDEPERQPRAPDLRHLDLAQQVRERADVILVAMRQEHGTDAPLAQVREVRQEEIDAEMLVPREREAGVDDDELLAHSNTVMFLPTSPRPPSGMIRSADMA